MMERSNGGLHENLTAAEVLEMKSRLDDDLHHLLDAQQTLNQEGEPGPTEDVMERVTALKHLLVKGSTARSWSEYRLRRMEMGRLLSNKLFMEDDNSQSVKNSLEKLDLAQQAFRIEKETKDLEEKLHNQELINFKLNTENTELLGKLKKYTEKAALPLEVIRNREYKRLKGELDVQCQSTSICKNIIQRLIFGLGLNLDEDKELENLAQKCDL